MFLCFRFTVNLTSCCVLRAASPSVRASLTPPDTQSSSRQISSHSKRPVKHTGGFLSPFIGQKVCRCSFKPAAGEAASPTQSSASGLEADPLQLRRQAGPQLLQNLLHPLGLRAPGLQDALAHVLQRRRRWQLVRESGAHTAIGPLTQDLDGDKDILIYTIFINRFDRCSSR